MKNLGTFTPSVGNFEEKVRLWNQGTQGLNFGLLQLYVSKVYVLSWRLSLFLLTTTSYWFPSRSYVSVKTEGIKRPTPFLPQRLGQGGQILSLPTQAVPASPTNIRWYQGLSDPLSASGGRTHGKHVLLHVRGV